MNETILILSLAIAGAAALYSSVGHGDASAYIALMALAGLAPEEVCPAALVLNILVAGNSLADDQAARRTVLMELDAAIERLRAKSNALEATSPIPKDFRNDSYWL
mgnify:CR=1 FL=1